MQRDEQSSSLELETLAARQVKKPLLLWLLIVALMCVIGISVTVWFLYQPTSVTETTAITVTPGMSVRDVVKDIADAGVVRSETMLYLTIQLYHRDETVAAGVYEFTPGQRVNQVAAQVMRTTPTEPLVRVTFPEGITAREMATIAATILPAFDQTLFLQQTADHEGYLWPDTYFVPERFTTEELVRLLQETHAKARRALLENASDLPLPEADIITLASIVEREANDESSMRTVAGILLNRLAIDMPLQADATIEYVIDTPLNELPPGVLAEQLRELDSPYNTYKIIGLPPTPIGNPGQQAIDAVLNPVASNYLFYITGTDGNFYYAETFDQHRINIDRHLR